MTAQYRYGTIIKTLTKEKKRTLLVAVTSITGGSRNFERQRISPVVNYRKCTQRSKCLSCGKRRFIAKKTLRPIYERLPLPTLFESAADLDPKPTTDRVPLMVSISRLLAEMKKPHAEAKFSLYAPIQGGPEN